MPIFPVGETRSMVIVPSLKYIYILFGPVKPELGVNPSGQENYSKVNI